MVQTKPADDAIPVRVTPPRGRLFQRQGDPVLTGAVPHARGVSLPGP